MPATNPSYQIIAASTRAEDEEDQSSIDSSTEGYARIPSPGDEESSRMMDTNDREVPGHIPTTNSSEELMPHGGASSDSEGGSVETGKVPNIPTVAVRSGGISKKELFTVFVLCFVNLINYMDRLTIAGECLIESK